MQVGGQDKQGGRRVGKTSRASVAIEQNRQAGRMACMSMWEGRPAGGIGR